MTTISPAYGALTAAATQRIQAAVRDADTQHQNDAATAPSTVLTVGTPSVKAVVYARPTAIDSTALAPRRAWSNLPQDTISTLMARNSDRGAAGGLASQWRGLGSALLAQMASTGTGYRQTLANYTPLQSSASAQVSTPESLDAATLETVKDSNAATVNLTIRTRSGQTITLGIAVDNGSASGLGRNGLQVEITSSGPLSSSERDGLATLAEGLDGALEGLGQKDTPRLDLSRLTDYDSSVFDSLDLSVKNPSAGAPLASFSLHLGTDRKTISYQGAIGQLSISVGADPSFGAVSPQQRSAAIAAQLQRVDAAAERGHADSRLVALFKDAFTQVHTAPQAPVWSPATALDHQLAAQIQPLQSGLADFDASFSGEFERYGKYGAIIEQGDVSYRASQKTTVEQGRRPGDLSITEVQSEKLTAQYLRSRSGVMLDTDAGNYDVFTVRDSTVFTTTLTTLDGTLSQAQRQTEQHLLQTMKRLVDHRVDEESSTPVNRSLLEQLLPPRKDDEAARLAR